MYNLMMSLAIAALFFVLTPGVLLSLPPKGGKFVVAATHAILFALIFHLTHKTLMNLTQGSEGFKPPCAKNGEIRENGNQDCCNRHMAQIGTKC
jgi:hypothetical protein